MLGKLNTKVDTVHFDMCLVYVSAAVVLYSGGDILLCLFSICAPDKKSSKLINSIREKHAEMLLCPHSVALVHSGEGHRQKEN